MQAATVAIQVASQRHIVAFPPFLPFPRQGGRNHATIAPLDPNSSSSLSQFDVDPSDRLRVADLHLSPAAGLRLVRAPAAEAGAWSRDDNAGLSGEGELLGAPQRPVARQSLRSPRLGLRVHRGAPPRRRRLPPEIC